MTTWRNADCKHWVTGAGQHSIDPDWAAYMTPEELGMAPGTKLVANPGTGEIATEKAA